jgi:hypothetical protein
LPALRAIAAQPQLKFGGIWANCPPRSLSGFHFVILPTLEVYIQSMVAAAELLALTFPRASRFSSIGRPANDGTEKIPLQPEAITPNLGRPEFDIRFLSPIVF